MWEFVKAGGVLMAPIIVLSIIALMVIIERGIRLRRINVSPRGLGFKVASQLAANPHLQLDANDPEINTPVGRVLLAGTEHAAGGLEYTSMQMQSAASLQIHGLEKHLNLLSIIGTVSPLLGLLGSVLGIIGAFVSVNTGSSGDPALLAAGLAQALICTAAGMFVAIPALIAHRLYQNKVLDYSIDMEQAAGHLLQVYFGRGVSATSKTDQSVIAELNQKIAGAQRATVKQSPRINV